MSKLMQYEKQELISYRAALIAVTAFLCLIGLLAIYASSSIPAFHKTGDALFHVRKQVLVGGFGFIIIFAFGHIPFRWIEKMTLPSVLISFLLLGLVHVPALEGHAKGASRWIMLGGISIQPAEFAKLALILFLAKNLSRSTADINSFRTGILPNLFVFAGFAVLLMLQPDFGSTAMLFVLTFVMLFTAGLAKKYIVSFIGFATAGIALAIVMAPYRLARLFSFLDPWADMNRSGFQIIQSFLAFQNGGFWGVGLGESRQKLYFLPEAHTDFILSVIGEELGLVGILLICSLFAYLCYLGFKIAFLQSLNHRKFLALGITSLITIQAFLNMGVTMGVLPTKGMTLPFVSNGANSLLVFLVAIAILARISQETQRPEDAQIIPS